MSLPFSPAPGCRTPYLRMTSALASDKNGKLYPLAWQSFCDSSGESTLIASISTPRSRNSPRRCWKLRNSELQNGHQ
jgi:hypothetical protein